MKLALFIFLFIFPLIAYTQPGEFTKLNQYLPAEKVASDFEALLQRPFVDFKPSFQSVTTDTVLIEKGFIYTAEGKGAGHYLQAR